MLLLPKSYFLSCPGITSLPYGQVSSESPLPSPPSTLQSKCRLCSSQGVALLSGIPAAPVFACINLTHPSSPSSTHEACRTDLDFYPFLPFLFFFPVCLFRAAPTAYGGSQAMG